VVVCAVVRVVCLCVWPVDDDDDILTPTGYPPPNTAADMAHSTHSAHPALRPHRATPRTEDTPSLLQTVLLPLPNSGEEGDPQPAAAGPIPENPREYTPRCAQLLWCEWYVMKDSHQTKKKL